MTPFITFLMSLVLAYLYSIVIFVMLVFLIILGGLSLIWLFDRIEDIIDEYKNNGK